MTQPATITATLSALQSGLTAIPVEAALTNIASWRQRLQGSDLDPTLAKLETALMSGNASAVAIGELLMQLGSQTIESAPTTTDDTQAQVQQLGQLLSHSGNSLMIGH